MFSSNVTKMLDHLTTPGSQYALNALTLDNPLEYARSALDGEMQAWVDAEDGFAM